MKRSTLSILSIVSMAILFGCQQPYSSTAGSSSVSKEVNTVPSSETGNTESPGDKEENSSDKEIPEPGRPESVDEQKAIFTISQGVLEVTRAGILTDEDILSALSGGVSLKVIGPLIEENYQLLSGKKIHHLDLSDVTDIPGGTIQVMMNEIGIRSASSGVIPLNFYEDLDLQTIVLPDTAEILPEAAFSGCKNLISVTGKGLRVIGYGAFSGTAVKTLYLPAVEEVGFNAFSNCKYLEELSLPAAVKFENDILYHSKASGTKINLPSAHGLTVDSPVFNGFSVSEAEIVLPKNF